jgi:two-component system, NtrC family, response regulator AtoC
MKKALVVDDERKMRRVLQMVLEKMGIEAMPAESAEEALQILATERVDLILSDLRLPGSSGLDLLGRVRESDTELPFVVLTAYGTVETAVEAMKRGAADYILKPFDVDALELTVRKALEMQQYRTENRFLHEQVNSVPSFESLVGDSLAIEAVYDMIRRVAPARSAVLITGETGTGKELVARAIHNLGSRRDRLFVPINCAAIPAELLETELFGHTRGAFTGAQDSRMGKFELADGGTLYLDEIGDMPTSLQAKLLRVLEEGVIERIGANKRIPVDVRIVSSTHRDLPASIAAGHFREDLYYRLNVLHIALPALRERREDIRHLAAAFIRRFAAELGKQPATLSAEALRVLERHMWPGNVRELQNLMERAVVLSDGPTISASAFPGLEVAPDEPETRRDDLALEPAVEEFERKIVLRALAAANDNKAQAARLLGVSERTLWYKLKRYRL